MSKKFFGLDIHFEEYDEVIFKSAEIDAIVTDIVLDSTTGMVEYLIEYKWGSLWAADYTGSLTGDYEHDCCLVFADEITKCSP